MPPLTSVQRPLVDLIFGEERFRRFTQDSPVMPDVWLAVSRAPNDWHDLLLTPHLESSAPVLARELRKRLGDDEVRARVAHNESYVVATLDFHALVGAALPLTAWWHDHVWRQPDTKLAEPASLRRDESADLVRALGGRGVGEEALGEDVSPDLLWLMRLLGRIEIERSSRPPRQRLTDEQLAEKGRKVLLEAGADDIPEGTPLWRVDQNRPAATAISRTIVSVKADAATRLFELDCSELRWAVIDSGVDATHPAFRKRDASGKLLGDAFVAGAKGEPAVNNTRVVATYDFTRLRDELDPAVPDDAARMRRFTSDERALIRDFRRGLARGRAIDWAALEPLLRVEHDPELYEVPGHEHGTHVAGILTADWRITDDGMPARHDRVGLASGLELYDLRVLRADGTGDEFSVIAALQFVRHLNAHKDYVVLHGANLSLSIRHDVANYACGRTPVCEECERVVASGTVVVAAAGNGGYGQFLMADQAPSEGYRSVSITDPGNAEAVITVGSTHRFMPHSYGVSYFSSRGPTGDGRLKPDLVAPGEKISSPIPERRLKSLDGTSMAAPHVSAAAALVMARYSEMIGQPARIKRLLCENATDLGRERYFQGSGMLDILRALQAL